MFLTKNALSGSICGKKVLLIEFESMIGTVEPDVLLLHSIDPSTARNASNLDC